MTRRLLMIDDEPDVMSLVGRHLRRQGWEFQGSPSPEKALELAASFRPDVILLDVEMPARSGWEVCRDLKGSEGTRHIPVVMLSGHRMTPEDKARGIEMGSDDYLTKPVDLTILMLKLQAILRVVES